MTRFTLIIIISIFSLNISAQDSNNIQRDFTIKLLEEKVNNIQQQIERSETHLKELQDAKKDEIEKVMKEKEDSLNIRMILYSGFFIALLSLAAWLLNWLGKKEIRNIVAEFTKTKVDEELSTKLSKSVIDAKLTEWGEPAIRKMVEELTEAGNKAKQHAVDIEETKEKYIILMREMEVLKINSDISKTTPEERQKVKEFNEVTQEVKKEENFSADDWFWKGVEARDEEKYEQAIIYFTKAIEIDSQKSSTWHNRAYVKDALQNFQEAIFDYDEAIKIDPKKASSWDARGSSKVSLGNYEDGILDYNEAIRLNPKYADAFNNRGYTKNQLQKYNEAILDLNKAVSLSPFFSNPYKHRAFAYYKLGNLNSSLDDINMAIKYRSDYQEAIDLKKEILEAISNSK